MRTHVIVGLMLGASSVVAVDEAAADERGMNVAVGGVIHVGDYPMEEAASQGEGGGRFALSWELPRLAMPDAPGYALDVSLVPELHVGVLRGDRSVEGLLGAGLRGELRIAQRDMGLFKVSAGGAFYAAVRGSVIGETRDPQLEIVAGEYLYLGRGTRTRIGFEGGYFERRYDEMDGATASGVVAQVYFGFGL